jgi:hypothetical protein
MITPYTEFLERRERRQRVKAAFAQPAAVLPGAPAAEPEIAIEHPAVSPVTAVAAERPLPNSHTDANGFRTLERAT